MTEHQTHRAEINRANAQHSTGPITPAGKLASSRNALKHGLASGELIIPGEDSTDFETLRDALLAEHQPANTTEALLVHQMAQSYWLVQRALRLQTDSFTEDGIDGKPLALLLRYQTTHERAFHKALNTLIRLQKDRRKNDRGFVSQSAPLTEPDTGFVPQNAPQAPHISTAESAHEPPEPVRAA